MRLWIATAVLLGIATLGVIAIPHAIDWDAYRPDIEATASALSGHDVTISGPIDVSLLPRPILIARDVAMAGRTDDAVGFQLSANQADVSMALGPLLAGRLVVRDLRLRRPVLTLDDGGSRRLRAWPPRWRDWTAAFLGLDLEAVGITDGRIELRGDRSDEAFSLNDLSLEVLIGGPDGPLEAAGLFRTRRHRFTMTAEFGRPDRDGMGTVKLLVNAQNGDDETTTLRLGGRVKPSGEDRHLSGRITLAGPDLQHGLQAISAATGYPSTFHSIAASQSFAVEGLIEADSAGIRSDDLQLKLSDKLGKGRIDLQLHPRTRLDLKAELPALRLADQVGFDGFLPLDILSKLEVPPGMVDIRLRELVYRGEAARQVALRLETGSDRVTRIEQAKAALPGLIDLQFEGGLQAGPVGPQLGGRIEAVGDDLGSSLAWFGLIDDDQTARWRGFSLESDVEISNVEIALGAIDMRLDSSRLQGGASLRFSERQRLTLDLDVARPNLDLYGADWDLKETSKRLAERFKDLDAEIDLRFERLIWQGMHFEDGVVSAEAESGQLTFRDITAHTVGDTTLSLDGMLDLDGLSADLSARLESQHPVRMLHHLDFALPLTSVRPKPLALVGKMKGTLDRFVLDVEANYDGGEAMIEGRAGWAEDRPWYDLRVRADHPDHQALAGQFGLAPLLAAGDAEGAFELQGQLRHEAAGSPWVLSGSTKLGPTSFTGSLAYQEGALAGPFDAKLSVGSPQKDSLAPFLISAGLRLTSDWTPARWLGRLPTVGLRTSWLDGREGTLSLASKGGLVGDGLEMRAKLDDGLLYIERLEASPWQGRLMAELTLERRREQPSLALAVELDQVDAAGFARWLGVKSGLSGPLDLRLEASSVGRTPYQLMAGLEGDVEIEAGPGDIEGLGVPALRQALIPEVKESGPAARSLALTFEGIETRAGLSRGIMTIDDGRLVLGPMAGGTATEAGIDGTVDLLLWIIDLTLSGAGTGGASSTEEAAGTGDATSTAGAAGTAAGTYRLVGPPGRPTGVTSSGN